MRRAALGIVTALALLLSGCIGAVQMEEYGYVQSFGIDRGENKKYAYSFLLQNYQGAGQDGASDGENGIVIGGEGDTIFEALALITAGLPYELNFTRTASIFFSEDIAREGGITQLIAISQSALKMRSTIKLVIVHGNTREFQEGLQVENSPDLMQMQKSILYSFSQEGTVPMTNLAIFYEAVSTGRFDPIVVYGGTGQVAEKEEADGSGDGSEKKEGTNKPTESSIHGVKRFGGMPAYADGTALFNGESMVGVLNGEETKYLLTARGELGKTFINYVYNGDGMLTLQISQKKDPKIEMSKDVDAPKFNIEVPLVCEIYMDSKGAAAGLWDEGLRAEIEEYIEKALAGMFELCRELDCDALGLGKEACKRFKDMEAWKSYNWKAKYSKASVDFRVNLRLWDANVITGIE